MKLSQPGRRPEVAEQARLDVLRLEPLLQERVVEQVDLADGEVVGRAPVSVDQLELLVGERCFGGGRRHFGLLSKITSTLRFSYPSNWWGVRAGTKAAGPSRRSTLFPAMSSVPRPSRTTCPSS